MCCSDRLNLPHERTFAYVHRLLSVVEDDAYGVPQTAADAADAMPEIDAIVAFRALDRPVAHGEDHRITLP
jgi:hypothetical protein